MKLSQESTLDNIVTYIGGWAGIALGLKASLSTGAVNETACYITIGLGGLLFVYGIYSTVSNVLQKKEGNAQDQANLAGLVQ